MLLFLLDKINAVLVSQAVWLALFTDVTLCARPSLGKEASISQNVQLFLKAGYLYINLTCL